MLKIKKGISLLAATLILLSLMLGSAYALDKPSVYEFSAVYNVSIDGLDKSGYTIWATAAAFAAAEDENGVRYLITDGSAMKIDEALNHVSEALLRELGNEGLIVQPEELKDIVKVNSTGLYIVEGDRRIPVTVAYELDDSPVITLEITDKADFIKDAVCAEFSNDLKADDKVSTLMLDAQDEELYGVVKGEEADLTSHKFTALDGTVTHLTNLTGNYSADAVMSDIDRSIASIGAPLVNVDGKVVGINSYDSEKDVTLSTLSEEMALKLASLDIIKTDMKPSDTKSISENPLSADNGDVEGTDVTKITTIIKYAIIAAIALVIILVILLIIRFRKSRDSEEEIDDSEVIEEKYAQRQKELRQQYSQRHPQEAHDTEAPKIRPAVRVQAVNKSDSQQTAVLQNTAENKYITLTIVSGKRKGFSLKVTDRVIIGRDPKKCALLFPASDTTISRVHCAITYIERTGDIVLEDLASANGTYSASSRRLIPEKKYRVRSGDRFYLGTPENMIEVK